MMSLVSTHPWQARYDIRDGIASAAVHPSYYINVKHPGLSFKIPGGVEVERQPRRLLNLLGTSQPLFYEAKLVAGLRQREGYQHNLGSSVHLTQRQLRMY